MTEEPGTLHDRKRCPDCDTLGVIDGLEMRSNKDYDARTQRSRKRIYECPDCDGRWVYYV